MPATSNNPTFFVIAKEDTPDLITTVMHAGQDGQEEAVAVFTDQSAAEIYLAQAGWEKTEVVAELETTAFLKWLLQSIESGPQMVAVNPDRTQQENNIRQNVVAVSHLMSSLGSALTESLSASELTA